MARERRSLWGSISTSKKVNRVSLKAALLYTWAIPHFDDEGFQDAEPRILKAKVVPFRAEISAKDIEKKLTPEIQQNGLWVVHRIGDEIYIQDPVFHERQSFKAIHKIPSKIKERIDQYLKQHPEGCSDTPYGVRKISKGKVSKEKPSKENIAEKDEEEPHFLERPMTLHKPPNGPKIDRELRIQLLKEQARKLSGSQGKENQEERR